MHNGKHLRSDALCNMASEVMESFLSFLVLSIIKQAFELPDFGTEAQVNGVS